jgi:hypothetical protein
LAARVPRSSPALFFEGLRAAVGTLPAGLVRLGAPATPQAIEAAERRLGLALPHSYRQFLGSFDGADLFHESVLVCGVGEETFHSLVQANLREERPPQGLVIAEGLSGDRFVLAAGDRGGEERVLCLRDEEVWLAGSSFPRWLEATLAREQILYGPDGEFKLEAFEPDGEELTPAFALRQAERALRKDADAALPHHDLGVALRRLGRLDRARPAFARAAELDPDNPWPWFDLGRTELALERPREAAEAFGRAAASSPGQEGARFLAWATRALVEAGERAGAERARAEALARHPGLAEELRHAATAAAEGAGDATAEAEAEAEALAAVFAPGPLPGRRLPVIDGRRTPRPPRAR